MSLHHLEDLKRTAERASEWLDTLADEPGPEQRAAFAAWISESPLHVREFLNIAAIDKQLESVDPERRIEVEGRNDASHANVLPLQKTRDDSQHRPTAPHNRRVMNSRWQAAASIATLALGLAAAWWWQERKSWEAYATAVGEQETMELSDGTTVSLNTKSHLLARFTTEGRDIRLLEGEALFKVRHDPVRPFRVYAGANVIQAIGTEFNVRHPGAGDVTVTVLEGKVQIEKRTGGERAKLKLAAGEEARMAQNGLLQRKRKDIDPIAVTAWRERRLVFYGATLEEIVEEFNRYNTKPQIVVQDDTLRARRYTVVLPANDAQSLIDYLSQSSDVVFERVGGNVIVKR